MSGPTNPESLYQELSAWATDCDRSVDDVMEGIIASFYDGVISDRRLSKFFIGADLGALRQHQLTFLKSVFNGEQAGGFTAERLYQIHEKLIVGKGLAVSHFDCFAEDFVDALKNADMPDALIERIMERLVSFRKVFKEASSRFATDREKRLFYALDDDNDGKVPEAALRQALADVGLGPWDERLCPLYETLSDNPDHALTFDDFRKIFASAGLLVERALKGDLAIPDFGDFSERVDKIFDSVQADESGQQAQYIPPLAEANPDQFGVAIVTTDGQVYMRGDHNVDFSIQSMCKPFNYCFALEEIW